MSYMIKNPKSGRQVKSDGDIGKKIIKEFNAFLEKAQKKVTTKESPKKITKKYILEMIDDYKNNYKMYIDLMNTSKNKSTFFKSYEAQNVVLLEEDLIFELIRYLKQLNVPESVLIKYGLMYEAMSLKTTKNPRESYRLIIDTLEYFILNPASIRR
jgi:hypothetical protein